MIKDILETELRGALKDLSYGCGESELISSGKPFADYKTHIVLGLEKDKEKKTETALKIIDILNNNEVIKKSIDRIEEKNGFINFFLSERFFQDTVKKIISEGDTYGTNNTLEKEQIVIEYTDPNPFKAFHIGHLMPNLIGESLSRIYEAHGAKLKRANYQGDVGMHVAKAVWAIKNGASLEDAYSAGHNALEEDEKVEKEIIEVNKKLYDKSDDELNAIYEKGRKESLDNFEIIYKKLDTKFDYYFFESETGEFGKKTVLENIKNGVFTESDGAIIYKGEDEGLHTRVFINSEGLPTYEAKELGLAHVKYEKFPYTKSVIVTGNEINDYFKVLLSSMKKVFPELAKKTTHIGHGMLRLSEGKMSSRTGNVIEAEKLIEEVKEKLKEIIKESSRDVSEKLLEHTSLAAIKYAILHQSIGKEVVFDFEKSLSFTGESGPYLQYTHARCKSILEKADKEGISASIESEYDSNLEIERLLVRYPEIVRDAGTDLMPHHIAQYLHELAQSFNTLYGKEQIVGGEGTEYKIALSAAVTQVLKNGLYLLGIHAPDKM